MIMQMNVNDLTILPEPGLTIKETNFRAKVKTFVLPILLQEEGCPRGEEMKEASDITDV